MALGAGANARHLSFAGPGKRDLELETAIRAGITLNAESEGEVDRALRIADRLGLRPRLAVRVNPAFEIKGSGILMGGGATPFDVDAAPGTAWVRASPAGGRGGAGV